MSRTTAVIIATSLLLLCGVVHGLRAGRFGTDHTLADAVERVTDVPMQIGEWVGQNSEVEEEQYIKAGAQGYWCRLYSHPRYRATFQVILMCGRSGKMSVHTPEMCYRGAGYDLITEPIRVTLKDDDSKEIGSFWTARFGKSSMAVSDQRIWWGWNADRSWKAPKSARWEYPGKTFLYKLYVAHELSPISPVSEEVTQEFFRVLLPELDRVLFAPQAGKENQ